MLPQRSSTSSSFSDGLATQIPIHLHPYLTEASKQASRFHPSPKLPTVPNLVNKQVSERTGRVLILYNEFRFFFLGGGGGGTGTSIGMDWGMEC